MINDDQFFWYVNNFDITEMVEQWIERMSVTFPFDETTKVLFRLSFAEFF